MTADMVLVLVFLGAALLFFLTAWLLVDLLAILALVCLAITVLVTPSEALSGFSTPAVVTVWAVFVTQRRSDSNSQTLHFSAAAAGLGFKIRVASLTSDDGRTGVLISSIGG